MPNESTKRWNGLGVAIIVAIVLPLLYVLSIGPAAWLMTNEYIEASTLMDAYYPVGGVAYKSDALGEALDWYLECCGGGTAVIVMRIITIEGSTFSGSAALQEPQTISIILVAVAGF